jgi:hypothetical protein
VNKAKRPSFDLAQEKISAEASKTPKETERATAQARLRIGVERDRIELVVGRTSARLSRGEWSP